jgi:hypothetical protein
MNCSGETPVDGWTAVNLAMVPFLVLAGTALTWLAIKDRRRPSHGQAVPQSPDDS